MVLKIFATFDKKLVSFQQPFYAPTAGGANRAFTDAVNDQQHPMNKHPEDYDLYELGEWDDQTGKFITHEPNMISQGRNVVQA